MNKRKYHGRKWHRQHDFQLLVEWQVIARGIDLRAGVVGHGLDPRSGIENNWLKTDDKFPRLPAIRSLSVEAKWLLTVLLSHCAEFETDGRILPRDMPMLVAEAGLKQPKKAFGNLLTNGVVLRVPDGSYYVPLYLQMNPTHERAERDRKSNRERQANFQREQREKLERLERESNVVSNSASNRTVALDGTGPDGSVVPLKDQQGEVDTEEKERPEVLAAKQWSKERLQKSRNRETQQ